MTVSRSNDLPQLAVLDGGRWTAKNTPRTGYELLTVVMTTSTARYVRTERIQNCRMDGPHRCLSIEVASTDRSEFPGIRLINASTSVLKGLDHVLAPRLNVQTGVRRLCMAGDPLSEMRAHYLAVDEGARLVRSAHGRLEFIRTQSLLRRFLPPPLLACLTLAEQPGSTRPGMPTMATTSISLIRSHISRSR